ncbi:hypothetical protein H1C71_039434, partial [Ictidomys tridecemlineatus]
TASPALILSLPKRESKIKSQEADKRERGGGNTLGVELLLGGLLFLESSIQKRAEDQDYKGQDPRSTIEKISRFLGKKLNPEELDSVLKNCSFQVMKQKKRCPILKYCLKFSLLSIS